MDINYSDIINSVKDWFGVIALILLVLGFSFYHITKKLSAKFQFAALALLMITLMPVIYIKLFSEIRPQPVEKPIIAKNPKKTPQEIIIGCGEVYNLLPSSGDGFLAVRSGSGKNDEKIDELYNNERVDILKKKGDRLQVIYRDGMRGWIHRTWVQDVACG